MKELKSTIAAALIGFVGIVPAHAQSCTNAGNVIVCDNGLTGSRIGNSVYWNDGSTSAAVPRAPMFNPNSISRVGGEPQGPIDGRVDRSSQPADVSPTDRWPSLRR
jgi:hypothetical protein